jgi:hypothetical protein
MSIRKRDWDRVSNTVRGFESRTHPSAAQIRARSNRQGRFDVLKVRNDTEYTLRKGHVIGIGDALNPPVPYSYLEASDPEDNPEQLEEDTNTWLGEPTFIGELYDERVHKGAFGILLEDCEVGDFVDIQCTGQALTLISGHNILSGLVIEVAGQVFPRTGEYRYMTTHTGIGSSDDEYGKSSHGGVIKWLAADTVVDAGVDPHRWAIVDLGGDPGPYPYLVRNTSGEDIPPYSCVNTNGLWPGYGAVSVDKPSDFLGPWLITWPHTIPDGWYGRAADAFGTLARYAEPSEEIMGGGMNRGPTIGEWTVGPTRLGIWAGWDTSTVEIDGEEVTLVTLRPADARTVLEGASGYYTGGYMSNLPMVFGIPVEGDTEGVTYIHWHNLGTLMAQIEPADLQDFLDGLTSAQVYDLLDNLSASNLASLLERLPGWSVSGNRFLKSVSGTIQWAT